MKRSAIESVLGLLVLLVASIFLVLVYTTSNLSPQGGYRLVGKFYAVDGLTVGSDVRIGGVKVGSVTNQTVDPLAYQAVIEMTIRDDVRIPRDSVAAITSVGLLGGKYVKIEPGSAETILAGGDAFEKTRDIIALEELLGKVIFLVTNEESN